MAWCSWRWLGEKPAAGPPVPVANTQPRSLTLTARRTQRGGDGLGRSARSEMATWLQFSSQASHTR